MPPQQPQGEPVTTFRIMPVTIGEDFSSPDGYFIKELIQTNEARKTVFYMVLGLIPTPKKINLVSGVINDATERKLRKGAKV